MSGWQLHAADTLAWLQAYDGEPFDGMIADPPYSSGGATRGERNASTGSKYVQHGSKRELPDFAGDNRDQRSFVLWSTLWLQSAWMKSREGATAWIFCDWRQLPSATDAVQCGGWVLRGIVPWDKGMARPQGPGRPKPQCEYVLFCTRGDHVGYDGAPYMTGLFRHNAPRDRHHMTEKPVALIREAVQSVPPGGLVLDPFAGSGAHMEGIVREGRRVIGLEIVPEIAAIARARMQGLDSERTTAEVRSGQGALSFDGDPLRDPS
jgi:site-specific DNA-methyltransferase (adenine-specific)